jgi:hypothetical protein
MNTHTDSSAAAKPYGVSCMLLHLAQKHGTNKIVRPSDQSEAECAAVLACDCSA